MKFDFFFSQKIQVSLKSDNNGYFTWRPIRIFYHIWRSCA